VYATIWTRLTLLLRVPLIIEDDEEEDCDEEDEDGEFDYSFQLSRCID
jgi:hypothetical protein